MLFHLVMVALVSTNIIIASYQQVQFFQSAEATFVNLFLGWAPGYTAPVNTSNGKNTAMLNSLAEFITYIEEVVANYYSFEETSIDAIYWITPEHHIQQTPHPLVLEVKTYEKFQVGLADVGINKGKKTQTETYMLTLDNPLGPLGGTLEEAQAYLTRVGDFSIHIYLAMIDVNPVIPQCAGWQVDLNFLWGSRGASIPVQMLYNLGPCHGLDTPGLFTLSWAPTFWLNVWIIVVALATEFLVVRAILKSFRIAKKQKDRIRLRTILTSQRLLEDQPPEPPSSLFARVFGVEFETARHFFNKWLIWNFVTSITSIASGSLQLAVMVNIDLDRAIIDVFQALNALMVWVNVIKYIEHFPRFYMLIAALNRGLPNVLRFVLGAAPIMVGYALAGNVWFGPRATWHQTPAESAVTLFSLLNGDSVHENFDISFGATWDYAIFSTLYVYSFVCLFIYAVLNIFILIMGEAYGDVKEAEHLKQKHKKLQELLGDQPQTQRSRGASAVGDTPVHAGSHDSLDKSLHASSPASHGPQQQPQQPAPIAATHQELHSQLHPHSNSVHESARSSAHASHPGVDHAVFEEAHHADGHTHGFRTMKALLRLKKQEDVSDPENDKPWDSDSSREERRERAAELRSARDFEQNPQHQLEHLKELLAGLQNSLEGVHTGAIPPTQQNEISELTEYVDMLLGTLTQPDSAN